MEPIRNEARASEHAANAIAGKAPLTEPAFGPTKKVFRVLIVDDEAMLRRLFGMYVERAGHTVAAQASNGVDGLAAFIKEKPDIVITDVDMPGGNGLVMVAAIREIDPGARIIVSTGMNSDERRADVARLRAVYMPKPVMPNHVSARIAEAVGE